MERLNYQQNSESICELEKKDIQRIVFLSFMHSQGNLMAHDNILNWIRQYYGRQSQKLLDEVLSEFEETYTASSDDESPLEHSRIHATGFFDSKTVQRQLQLFGVLTSDSEPLFQESKALNDVIFSDVAYMERGRPERSEHAKANTLAEKHFSFFVTYALRSKQTGDMALDAIYSNFLTMFSAVPANMVDDFITLYNSTHCESPLSEEEQNILFLLRMKTYTSSSADYD